MQDKFKELQQSGLVCQCVITSQGVVQSSLESASASAVSATGKNCIV